MQELWKIHNQKSKNSKKSTKIQKVYQNPKSQNPQTTKQEKVKIHKLPTKKVKQISLPKSQNPQTTNQESKTN